MTTALDLISALVEDYPYDALSRKLGGPKGIHSAGRLRYEFPPDKGREAQSFADTVQRENPAWRVVNNQLPTKKIWMVSIYYN